MKVVKFLLSNFENETRDRREVSVLVELGYEVVVLCKGEKGVIEKKDGYIIRHVAKPKMKKNDNRVVRYIKLAYYFMNIVAEIKKEKANCISAHDIYALIICNLAYVFSKKKDKPRFVYDSHEFEIGRSAEKEGKVIKKILNRIERILIQECSFSIMVNSSIADEVFRIQRLSKRPIVVRNIPNYWTIDYSICKKKRVDFEKLLKKGKEEFFVMYHGGILPNRGLENIISAINTIADCSLIILGFGEIGYINQLKNLANETKVLFLESVNESELWKYIGAVDLGVTLAPNTCLNHYYMLPNKLFECIQSETPIVGSNFPEIKKVIEGYNIGVCCNPHKVEDIANTIMNIKSNPDKYLLLKNNIKKAKNDLCWEKEKFSLIDAYIQIDRVLR